MSQADHTPGELDFSTMTAPVEIGCQLTGDEGNMDAPTEPSGYDNPVIHPYRHLLTEPFTAL